MPQEPLSPGDVTGRKRAQLQQKHAEEQKKRAEQMSMVTAQREAVKDEVVDYTQDQRGQRPRDPELLEGDRTSQEAQSTVDLTSDEPQEIDPSEDPTIQAIVQKAGQDKGLSPDQNVEGTEQQVQAPRRQPGENPAQVRNTSAQTVAQNRTVRSHADLEDVTIGAGTSYTFERGRKYIVPHNVAHHLAERGYVEILR